MNWQYVEIDEVFAIHQGMIRRAGTEAGVRDFSLLHSAVERPKATYSGVDLYPTVFLKAAALLQSLCLNHPFTDGNKRTAWLSGKRFLHLNGYHLVSKGIDAADFMVAVDNEKLAVKEIALWLKEHAKRR
ncbi:MAG: type II toxin-antitoxin system death-on-curing family toxin [Candidatus Chisholmbacteria bacterium]|nr:type II toxin-antitoxin system death-on-curing family toxin [Candidatus Chisholmbacteria bacterium]